MKNLKVKLHRLNNSYESEPSSSGSASSLSEHHDNTMSDDENMNLPYLLKPPSYQNEITVETTNPESPYNKCETKADRDLRYGLSDVSSPESLFEGFEESSYEKDIEAFCTANSSKTKLMSSQDTKESSCLLDVQSQHSQQLMEPICFGKAIRADLYATDSSSTKLMSSQDTKESSCIDEVPSRPSQPLVEPNFFGKAIRADLYTTDSSSTKLMSSQDTKESSCLVELESQPSQPLVEPNFFGKAIRADLYTTDSSSTKLMSSQDTKDSSCIDEVPSRPSQPLVEPNFFGKAIREDLYTTDSSSTKLMSSQDTKESSCMDEVPSRPPAPLIEPNVYGKAITAICTTNSSSKKLMSSQDTKESSCMDEVPSRPSAPLMEPDVYGKAIPEVVCITNPSTTEMTSSQDTKESSCMDKVQSQNPPPLMEHNFYGEAMTEVFCTTNSSTTNSSTTNSSTTNSSTTNSSSSNSSSSNSSTSNSSSTNSSTRKITSSQNTKELSRMDDVPSPIKPAPPLMEPDFYGKTIKVVICTTNSSATKLMSSQDTTEPSCMDAEQSPAPPPLIEPAKNGPSPGKLLFPNFYDVIVEENSCNAVDVILSNELADSQSRSSNSKVASSGSSNSNVTTSELSFNGKIKSMCNPDESNVKNSTPLHQPLTIEAQRLPHLLEATLNNSYVTESSFVLKKYTNEKSPDLFADDDDDDEEDVDCNNENQSDNEDQNINDESDQNDEVNNNNDLDINDFKGDNDHKSANHDNNDQKNFIQKGYQEKLDHNQADYQNYSPVGLKNDHENIDEENDYNEENNDHNNDHEYIDEESDHNQERNEDNKNDNKESNDEEIVRNKKNNDHIKNSNHENIDQEHYHIDENNEGIENDNQENIDEYNHNEENNAHIQNDYHENIDEENDLNEDKNDNHDYIKENDYVNDNADDQENDDHNNDDHENDYLIVGHKPDHNKEGDNYDDNDGNNYDHDGNNDENKTNDHKQEVHVNDHKMFHRQMVIKNKDHQNIDENVDHNVDQHVYQHNVDLHVDNNHIENCNDDMSIAEEMQMQSPPQCYTLDDVIEEVPEEQLQDELMTTNNSLNCPTESSFIDDQTMGANENPQISDNQSYLFRANCKRELELLQRTRSCLSGIPPPPTVTIPKIDLINAVLRRKNEILNFYHKDWQNQSSTATIHGSSDSITVSLLKPTHSLEETQAMGWRDILGVRQHGLSFNLSKASESNEYLSLSVIDRYIGAETASSYQLSPSSAKKRNLRLKMLTASPGNRLSHLAKRRAIFSSANLATTSLKSTSSLGTQILLDKKKPKHRRKVTPKRKTPGSKKKNVRKTPSSSARKRLYRCDSAKPGPSRETSKRALFQSPAKTTQPQKHCLPKPTIKPEIATRVEKSKRALFSPDKQSENSSHASYYNSYLGGDSSNSNHAYTNSYGFSSRNNSTQQLETLLQKRKRHRADDDDEDDAAVLAKAQSSKIFRGSMHSLTPRALQIKSESFCIGAGSSAQSRSHSSSNLMSGGGGGIGDVIEADLKAPTRGLQQGLSSSQRLLGSRNNSTLAATASATKLLRAQSESATMNSFSNSLTENQRKKLLWAVSQALQEKKITAKHESFKEFASVLARVVRRIFQEYYLKGNASNSETMLRLAKKYAYNVIAGKNVDDIYFHAKAQIDEQKRKSVSRLSGYIAPEEYENHKLSQQKLSQKGFHGSMQSLFGTENTMDCLSMSMSQASSVGLSTTLSSMGMTSQASTLEQLSQPEIMHNSGYSNSSQEQGINLLIQPNPTLQKSSSKSNLCGLALRENVDCEQRRSAQKNFTGKDQRNVSPYSVGGGLVNRLGSAVKLQPNVMHDLLAATAAKAKRQISFDS